MNTRFLFLVPLLLTLPSRAAWEYPPTKTVDASDTYFGVTYKDPYRWLENLKDKEVADWFKAQANLTDATLAKIPGRDALAKEWMALDTLRPANYSAFDMENDRVFYKKTLGGEKVGKIFFREGWNGAEVLLFDPGPYKPGVTTTVENFLPSWDGKHVALALSAGGAEYSEIRIIDVDHLTLLPETFYPSYGPVSWLPGNDAFLYDAGKVSDIKNPSIELHRKTRLHHLGSDFKNDQDFFSDESYPDLGIQEKEFPTASVDESYPDYVTATLGTVQPEFHMLYAPISQIHSGKIKWQTLCKCSDNLVRGFELDRDYAYAVTHEGAPKYKVVRTTLAHPDWSAAQTVIPEAPDSIQSLNKSKNYMFVVYSDGIVGRVLQYNLASGAKTELKLPASGDVSVSCPDVHSDRCVVTITSWIAPATRYDYDPETGMFAKSVFNVDVHYPGFDDLVTEEVEAPGHDGVMVPLSIIRKKGMPMDGSSSCILEGYGAYGISYTPYFSVQHSIAGHGVVVAYAHPRGGSEKGQEWYKAGFKTTKPNTWKDFISCAEYLVKKGYTSPQKLAGAGTSAGGILISRAITERPDLFRAAICNVGCANALRLQFTPNGPVNTPEFGVVTDPVECKALAEMDGVSHVQKGVNYPALMGVGGWNDPRVPPWQPGKLVAAVQADSASGNPVFMKVNFDDGHFTEDKTVTFENFAGQFAFLLWQTGHPEFQPIQ